jgi:hypothetical protein
VTQPATERCELTELLVDECAHCKRTPSIEEQVRAEHAEMAARSGWHTAIYPGACSSCREPFGVGTPITRDTDGGWMAACCATDDLAKVGDR